MGKELAIIAAALSWHCTLPAQTQTVTQDTLRPAVLSSADKAQILSSVLAARYRFTRDSTPYADPCNINEVLGTNGDVAGRLRPDVRGLLLAFPKEGCSADTTAENRQRLIFKRVVSISGGAIVECGFAMPGVAAHVETYRLRRYRSAAGRSWAVTEIRISDFTAI